jgi:large repetitive protein
MGLSNTILYKNRLFLLLFFVFSSSIFLRSQTINLTSFNAAATYTSGSSVSVIVNPTGVFKQTNRFVLELSDEGGSWPTTPIALNTHEEFYIPVINGTLPAALASGNYKLRIRSTQPEVIVETVLFKVVANGTVPAIPNFKSNIVNGTSSFNCLSECGSTNNIFGQLQAAYNATTNIGDAQRICNICSFNTLLNTYSASLTNVQSSVTQNLSITTDGEFDIPNGLPIGTYAVEIEAKSISGISSIYSNIFIFQGSGTSFGNSSGENVCVGSTVDFAIDLNPNSGIGRNYSGSKYNINFGDGKEMWLTHAEILANPAMSHVFDAASCGSGSSSQTGYSQVKFSLYNKGIYSSQSTNYCTTYSLNGSGAKKDVNISKAPIADFTISAKQCIDIPIVATNKTVEGSYGTDVCLTKPHCDWWYKTPSSAAFKLVSISEWINAAGDLTIPKSIITEPGCWKIKLQTYNPEGCTTPTEKELTIQIEATPIPTFTMSPASPICENSSIKFTNTTNVIGLACQDPTYSWEITPIGTPATSDGFIYNGSTNASSLDPEVKFTQPGTYQVVLKVTNTCGAITSSTPTNIQVNGDPSVTAGENNLTDCTANTSTSATPAAEYILDLAIAVIKPIYTSAPYAPASYEWTVDGAGVTAADYSYVDETSASSPYPKIKFTAFKTYTLKVKVNGNCMVNKENTVTLTLNEIPKLTNTGAELSQVICSGTSTVALNLTASMSGTTFDWKIVPAMGVTSSLPSLGTGATIPAAVFGNGTSSDLTVEYIITPRNNNCSGVPQKFVVTVHPEPDVKGIVPIVLCNNSPFTASAFESKVDGTAFSWTNDNIAIGLGALGDGNLPEFTPTNAETTPIVANVTVTPKNGVCPGEKMTFKIFVNPTPTVAAVPSLVKCNGEQSGPISFTGTVPGTIYKWTNDNPTIGIGANGTGDISSIALVNNTNMVQIANFTVTPTFEYKGTTCNGTFKTFTITVNPTAQVTQPSNQNICNGGSTAAIAFTTLNTGGTTTYNWINNVPSIGLAASGSGDIPAFAVVNAGNAPKISTITVTPTFTNDGISCTGASKTFTITANPIPSIQPLFNKEFCDGVSISSIGFETPVSNTLCTWTNSNTAIGLAANGAGNISTFTATNPTANPITATIEVIPTFTNGGVSCTGTAKVFTITVNPTIKTLLSSAAQTICSGESTSSVTLSSASSAVSYNWQVLPSPGVVVPVLSGSTNTIPAQTLVNTTASPVNVVFEATATLTDGTGCVGPKSIHTITVNPKATIGAVNTTICSGGPFSITPADGGGNIIPNGTQYTWSTPTISSPGAISGGVDQPTAQSVIGGTLTNTTSATATATYSVTPISGTCIGSPFDVVVTVNPTPTVNSVGNRVYCAGVTSPQIDFTGDVAGSTFDWTCDNASIGLTSASGTEKIPSFTTANSTNSPIVATVRVTPRANDCVGTILQFTITVNPRPIITTSLGGVIICNNTPAVSIPLSGNVIGTSFDWTNDAPTIGLAASGSGDISGFTAVNTGSLPIIATVNVIPKANGCEGTPKSFTITVNPTPTVDAIPNQELCSGFPTNAVNFTGNIGTTTYHWTNNNSAIGLAGSGFGNIPSFAAINNGSTPVTATITVTPEVNGCSGSQVIFTIIVNPTPAFTSQPILNSICKDGVLPALSVAFVNGTGTATYQWFSNTANNTTTGTPIPSTNSPTYTPSSSAVGTLYYYCKVTFSTGGCANLTSTTAAITINALPTMSLEPLATQNLCVGGTIPTPLTVGYRDGVGVASYQWYSNTSSDPTTGTAISAANASAYTPPVFTVPGKYYYYAVIGLDGIGCGFTKSAVAEINVVPDPIVTLQPIVSQTLCQNSPAAILEVKASGGIGDYAYQWYRNANSTGTGTSINGATDATYTPSTSTVGIVYYYCVVTQPNGVACSVTSDFAEVKVNLVPTIVTQPLSSTICRGDVPTQLSVACANGVGTPQYQWYSNTTNDISGSSISGETNATFNPPYAAAGTVYYYCVITYPTGGCSVLTSNIANVTIHQYPVISPFTSRLIGSGTSFSVNPIDNGTDIVPVGTTYSWSAPVVVPANAITGATAQVGQTGISQLLNNVTRSTATATYTVTPQKGGCPGTDFKIEVEVRPLLISNAVPKNISCFGEIDGSVTTNIEGGIPPYTVQWTGPNGFTSTNASISWLAQGEYTLKITDSGNSLPFIKTYTVIEPGEITLTTDINKNVSCFGAGNGEIAISVTGGTGAYTYAWTKNNIAFATTDDITNLSPGDYVVTVSDVNNCGPKTLSFTITEPAPLKIDLISKTDVLCFGDSTGVISVAVTGGTKIEFTPGVFDYKYAWVGPKGFTSASQNLEHLFAGTYNLKVTDKQGCELTFSVTVTQQSEIIIKATASPITCYGANNASIQLDVTGGVPPYQTLWNNLASGESLDNLAAGDYVVTVIDALSCSRSLDVTIPEAPIFKITPVVKQISCFGAHDGSITLNYIGDSKLSKLVWSDGSTSGTTRNNLGPGTYTVTINDGSPCIINKTFIIVEPQPIVLQAVLTNALSCDNANSGAIDLTVSGGTPPYIYSWSNGAKTADLTNITSGNYLVTVVDANTCVQSAQYIIKRPAPIAIAVNIVPDFDCVTQVVSKISTAKVTGGVPPYTLTWSSGKISGTNNEIMQTTQNSMVILDVVDALGCTGNYTFKVDIPTVGVDYQLVDCNAHSYQYNALVPLDKETYIYTWDFGDGVSSTLKNPTHAFATTGNHTVKLTMKNSICTTSFTEIITVEANPVVTIDKTPIMCQGDSIVLRASGAYTYRWNEGALVDSMLINRAGDYTVIGYSKAGCTDTLNFKVTYYDSYNYTIQTDKVETSSDESPIHMWTEDIPFSQYYWDFGDGKTAEGADQSHTYDRNQVGHFDIKLKVMNPNGCVENATKRIWVLNKSTVNTFSPNNDGINDVFMKGWHLQIFNRNGVMLHEGNDGWDGKYNGQTVKNDTYFYVLFYESETGTKTRTGYITVMW